MDLFMSNDATAPESYYHSILSMGKLRTVGHASRLSKAVLHALGFNLSGPVKKKLAESLPENLSRELTRGWRLIHFRNTKLTALEFAKDVSLHSGNTDAQVGLMATQAVFHSLKQLIDGDLSHEVAKDLSPELRKLWNTA